MNFLRIVSSDLTPFSGYVKYLHNGRAVSSGAFEKTSARSFELWLPRRWGTSSVSLLICAENGEQVARISAEYTDFDKNSDVYVADISALDLPDGLYFMKLRLLTAAGELYGVKGKGREIVLSESDGGNLFQFSIVDFAYPLHKAYRGGIIYHIFVDRFFRSGKVPVRDDAILLDDWYSEIPEYPPYPGAYLENNTFYGGTLYGIVEKLDYIKSLGTSMIYLSPIFEAYSNHKYDTADYMTVDAMFGGEEALKLLISEAEQRGIGIILDGVFNHTGSDSIYFNKKGRYPSVGAYQSQNSPYYSWFDFKSYPDDYTCWWNIEILPRINPSVKECAEYFVGKGGVIEKYAKMGIAGIRLDVADELSDEFIARIKKTLYKNRADSILYGEVWEDASNKIAYGKRKTYYLGKELDGVMNYPYRVGIIDYIRNKSTDLFEYALNEVTFNAPKRVRDMQMNLLGTHDTERIITVLAGRSAAGCSNKELLSVRLSDEERGVGENRVKLAYTILATLPGIPAVFYGDEVGLEGYKDPFNRRPFPWRSMNENILAHYRKIGEIRKGTDAYVDGDFELLSLTRDVLAFKRTKGNSSYITLVNNSSSPITVKLSGRSEELIFGSKGSSFAVPSESAHIYKTNSKTEIEIV